MSRNIVRFAPFHDLDRVFDRVFPQASELDANAHDWQPLVDIRETGNAYQVDVELPSIAPKDVRVELRDGLLRVSGERRSEDSDDSGRVHRRERRYGKFTRSFRLPEDADANAIRASAKDGVVSITVAKSAKAETRAIEVESA